MARQPNIGRVYGDSVEIASSTNACGIGLRCLGTKLASRTSGEMRFLLVIPAYLQPRPHNWWKSTPTNPTQTKRALLQLRVLRFGLLQDGDVGVGVFPEGEEVFVGCEGANARGVGIGSARGFRPKDFGRSHAQARQSSRPAVPDDAAVVENFLKFGSSGVVLSRGQICLAPDVGRIKARNVNDECDLCQLNGRSGSLQFIKGVRRFLSIER